jgi:hypothetical protein
MRVREDVDVNVSTHEPPYQVMSVGMSGYFPALRPSA